MIRGEILHYCKTCTLSFAFVGETGGRFCWLLMACTTGRESADKSPKNGENGIYDMIELDIRLEEHGLKCLIQ